MSEKKSPKHDLPALTRDKHLVLYRPGEKERFRIPINRTLYKLVKMYCENEDIALYDYVCGVIIQDLTRKGQFKFRRVNIRKPGNQSREWRKELSKRMRRYNQQYWYTERSIRLRRRQKRDAEDLKWERELYEKKGKSEELKL